MTTLSGAVQLASARGTMAEEPLHERARRFRVEGGVRRLLKRPEGSTPLTASDNLQSNVNSVT